MHQYATKQSNNNRVLDSSSSTMLRIKAITTEVWIHHHQWCWRNKATTAVVIGFIHSINDADETKQQQLLLLLWFIASSMMLRIKATTESVGFIIINMLRNKATTTELMNPKSSVCYALFATAEFWNHHQCYETKQQQLLLGFIIINMLTKQSNNNSCCFGFIIIIDADETKQQQQLLLLWFIIINDADETKQEQSLLDSSCNMLRNKATTEFWIHHQYATKQSNYNSCYCFDSSSSMMLRNKAATTELLLLWFVPSSMMLRNKATTTVVAWIHHHQWCWRNKAKQQLLLLWFIASSIMLRNKATTTVVIGFIHSINDADETKQ